jgi:hypothetical protein
MPRMSQQQQQREKEQAVIENVNVETQTDLEEYSPKKWEKINNIYNFVVPYFQWIYLITKVYILWIIIHYISVQLYVKHCVPSSLWGFITSPILVSSPHCKAMRWILHIGANTIDNMWTTIGVWFSTRLLQMNEYF